MDFEVLINDSFLKVQTANATDGYKNKLILSLLNDYEDGSWRYDHFLNFVWDNIALTALSANERMNLASQSHSSLRAAAKNLRFTDLSGDIGQGSELAEIVLYGIMHHHYKALAAVPKIFYKQNPQDNVKGADSVHIVLEPNNDFSLWIGEAKFYNSIEDTRLSEIVKSVGASLSTNKLKKENRIVCGISDIDHLVGNAVLAGEIRQALSASNSIDLIKPRLHVPILLLHECSVTAATKEMNLKYKNEVRKFHLDRATSYFKKQLTDLSNEISKYSEIKFHLILFPVPSKSNVVSSFADAAKFYKGK